MLSPVHAHAHRGVGVQKCITYDDVNDAVAEAKDKFSGGHVPPEIYELTSDTPTPEHVTIPAEIGMYICAHEDVEIKNQSSNSFKKYSVTKKNMNKSLNGGR